MSAHQTETCIAKLQSELNEATVKHSETVYWLQLELNTTRKAKEAVEDRMGELYRDMQELEKPKKSRPIQPDAAYVMQQQKQIDKYERMLKVLNNQIGLVRTSADSLVKNLKDEIADLMEDKLKNELQLMNKLSALDREKRDLEQQLAEERRKNCSNLDSRQQQQQSSFETASADTPIPMKRHSSLLEEELSEHSESPTAPSPLPTWKTAPPKPPCRHKSIEYDDPTPLRSPRRQKSAQDDSEAIVELIEDDLKRLREENRELKNKLQKQKMEETSTAETERLSAQLEQYKTKTTSLDAKLAEARNKAHETLVKWTREKADLQEQIDALRKEKEAATGGQVTEDNEIVLAALDRVALLWDRADQSIQSIESVMMEVRPNPSQDAERALSMLETASLVQGQIKVSLMMIELQFRNGLTCLEHDQSATSAFSTNASSKLLADKMQSIQAEAMESIIKIESIVEEQIKELRVKSEKESLAIREMHENKVIDLRQLLDRQAELEKEIERLQSEKTANGQSVPSAVEMLVSQKALETLQSEVLLVVERVKEKNETIGRLNAEIEEHKVRERTIMEELKRHMKDQADRQMAEQQRLMEQHAQCDSSEGEGSTARSEYEEKTVEESLYDEITVRDENTTVA